MTQEPFHTDDLATRISIRMLSTSLRQVIPVPDDHKFDSLLRALDEQSHARS